jgi:hypothetical protein
MKIGLYHRPCQVCFFMFYLDSATFCVNILSRTTIEHVKFVKSSYVQHYVTSFIKS